MPVGFKEFPVFKRSQLPLYSIPLTKKLKWFWWPNWILKFKMYVKDGAK